MKEIKKHSQSKRYPSEIVVLGLLYAWRGGSERGFYRWIERDYLFLFPHLPHRTRLFRLFATHQGWTARFLAQPSLLGVTDTYGIEFIHPRREGRSKKQIGKKGKSNHRWIAGGKLCFVLDHLGRVVDWDCNTANVYDALFHPLIQKYEEKMVILGDSHFHSKEGDPDNLLICKRGEWNERMLIETVLSLLTRLNHLKHGCHRLWECFSARLAFTLALYNLLIEWDGLKPDEKTGFVPLSIAQLAF
jgi:hypothetical protein